MEKYFYNTTENYIGMDIEGSFQQTIKGEINLLTEFEYFELIFYDKIISFFNK